MALTVSDGFPYYISLTGSTDVLQLFQDQSNFNQLISLTEAQANYRYAPGKWSIKQIIEHMTDHERIMTYRALRFSRKDTTVLPGYDQDLLVANGRANDLSLADLLDDFRNVRQATKTLVKNLSPEQFKLKGTAWKFELTVEEFLRATIGHELHHITVIRDKYLK
jgi:hypothetical protein